MRAACCICSDLFDEVNSISSTYCGHVYHTSCLMLWVQNSSKSCPKCRVPLKVDQCVKLYFDFNCQAVADSEILENTASDLKAQLLAKQAELIECRKERDEIKTFVKSAERRTAEMQQVVYQRESELADLRLKTKEVKRLKSIVEKLEASNSKLFSQVQVMENIQIVVEGSKEDVEKILQDCGSSPDSSKQLAVYCTVLKKELEKLMHSKSMLLDLNSKLKLENSSFAAKLRACKNKLKTPILSSNTSDPMKPAGVDSDESLLKISDNSCSSNEADISHSSASFNNLKYSLHVGPKSLKYSKISNKGIKRPFSDLKNNDDSIIRNGFNGLGGHDKFINIKNKTSKF